MELTRAEEEVMNILWEKGPSFVKELVEGFDDPKPAYTTVSTIIRILEKKGAVNHEKFGKSHRYFAAFPKADYRKREIKSVLNRFFGASKTSLVSHLIKEDDLSLEEINALMEELKRRKDDH